MKIRHRIAWMALGLFAAFTLFAQSPRPTVDVLSPVGGERWQEGSTHVVSWEVDAEAAPDSIQLRLVASSEPGARGLLLATFQNENPGVWKWEDVHPAGKWYVLQVTAYFGGKAVKGASSAPFMIVPRKPPRFETLQMSMADPGGRPDSP